MKILSITTSSPICGVAILEDLSVVKEITLNNGLTHSETLLPNIKEILEETNLKLTDINLITCDIGPGSFTGIRIGVSSAKAFRDSLGIHAIGVTSLEALKLNYQDSGVIIPLIDAKNNNVYNQVFENNEIKRPASFDNIEYLLKELKSQNFSKITFVGSGSISYKEQILKYFQESYFLPNNNLSAKNIGIAGFNKYISGNIKNIEPFYIKKHDIETKNNK